MKGDFSRLTFDPAKHFSGVRLQQGRVQLDADWNEQLDITMHRLESEITDFVGPSGVPADAQNQSTSFEISIDNNELYIGPGRCYIFGKLFENETRTNFTGQPDYPGATLPEETGRYLVYLDAWQRHITSLEDSSIRESALGGPDTATRIKNVWQTRVCQVEADVESADLISAAKLSDFFARKFSEQKSGTFLPLSTGTMQARMNSVGVTLENQLYRIEIHDSGPPAQATFKWSRDNGSVAARVAMVAGNTITINTSGGMTYLSFGPGQWVELSTQAQTLRDEPGQMVRLQSVQGNELIVEGTLSASDFEIVRRWDSPEGPQPLLSSNSGWILLEDEIEVKFATDGDLFYKSGDYWLIPARHLTGDIDWLRNGSGPMAQAPHGVRHYTTALALLDRSKKGQWTVTPNGDLRTRFKPITVGLLSKAGDVVEGSLRIVQNLQVDGVMSGIPNNKQGLVVQGDLTIKGNLNVSGTGSELIEQQVSGDVVLGDRDQSNVTIYGVLRTRHSSNRLQVGAPLQLNAPLTVSGITMGDSQAAAVLDIQSDQQLPLRASGANPTGTRLKLENTSNQGRAWELVSTGASSPEGAGHLLFSPGNMRITRSGDVSITGKVGIGTTTPNQKLSVSGAESTADGFGAAIGLENSASGGAAWYLRAGATGTTTPAGGFSIADKSAYRLVIDNSGNVGIGTTGTLQAKLQVNGAIMFGGNEWQLDTGSWQNANIRYSGSAASATFGLHGTGDKTVNLLVDGNVGIGTTSPGAQLDIKGVSNTTGQVSLQLRSGNTNDNFLSNQVTLGYNNTSTYRHAIKTRHNAGGRAGNAIDFYVWKYLSANDKDKPEDIGSLHTLTLEGGNVGIGTTSPGAKLEVNGSIKAGALTVGAWPADGNFVLFGANSIDQTQTGNYALLQQSGGNNADIGRTFLNSPVDLRFRINNSDKMVLANNGNVGIGTTGTPQAKLQVNGAIMFGGNEWQLDTGSWQNANIQYSGSAASGTFGIHGSGDKTISLIIDGTVGIGATSPIQTLDVNGRIHVNNGVIQRGGAAITNTADLGLYSQVEGNWIRIVTNKAPIKFFTDSGIGATAHLTIESSGTLIASGGIKSGDTFVIKDIRVGIYGDSKGAGDIGSGWYRLSGDLNSGAGGKFIYLEILRAT